MALPADVAALVAALEANGFAETLREESPGRRSRLIEMSAARQGVRAVRIVEDLGTWGVEVLIEGGWYDPFFVQRVLDGQPHQQRALSHQERLTATTEVVRRFTGSADQVMAIRTRERELAQQYRAEMEAAGSLAPDAGGSDGEISNWWIVICGVAIAGFSWGVEALVDVLLDDPSWAAGLALQAAIEIPILVIALKLWLRRRVQQGYY